LARATWRAWWAAEALLLWRGGALLQRRPRVGFAVPGEAIEDIRAIMRVMPCVGGAKDAMPVDLFRDLATHAPGFAGESKL